MYIIRLFGTKSCFFGPLGQKSCLLILNSQFIIVPLHPHLTDSGTIEWLLHGKQVKPNKYKKHVFEFRKEG